MSNKGASAKNVIVTPLERLEGFKIHKYVGFVLGSAVYELDIAEAIRISMYSKKKRVETLSKVLKKLRHRAIEALKENAHKMGANAVFGVRVQIWSPTKHVFEAYAYGTAVEVGVSALGSQGKRGKQ